MARFGAIPNLSAGAAARPTAGMLPAGIGGNIGADLAVPMSQPAPTRGLSGKGFGSSLPKSFAMGMQKGMQVGTQAAMEQARMAQIRQAEFREKIKQAEAAANMGIQQLTQIVQSAPNRTPALQKAIMPIVQQVSDLAKMAGQFDPDAGMRIASNLRFAIGNAKTQAEVHTAKALGQQQPQAAPGQGPTPSPAAPPPLSGAAVAAGARPPGGPVTATSGANGAPAAPSGVQVAGSGPMANTFAPGGVGSLPGPGSQMAAATPAATPVAYGRPATPAPLVQPAEAGITYGQTPEPAAGPAKGGKFVPPGPTPGSTPSGAPSGKPGKEPKTEKLGADIAGKLGMMRAGVVRLAEKIREDGTRSIDILAAPSTWGMAGSVQSQFPSLPVGRITGDDEVSTALNAGQLAVEGSLRLVSGAQVPETELRRFYTMFLPWWGDTDRQAQRKLAGLQAFMTNSFRYAVEGRRPLQEAELADFAAAALKEADAAGDGGTPELPVPISGDEEYNALPENSLFIGPDGLKRRKPGGQASGMAR